MKTEIREVIYSEEYEAYYAHLDRRTKEKYDYVTQVIKTQYRVNKKFVKHLEGTPFYEARISVGTDEHRTTLFAIETTNFMECKRVLYLNSFLKKDTKQYKGEIRKAHQILEKYL
ncbi:MAG: type II toxin-antitoxin system RelE/ParE family toxin [Prevotella sp.]|nr:type II toxin-antitoxin system RelE/ParE family toxin [Prevotella sp.]